MPAAVLPIGRQAGSQDPPESTGNDPAPEEHQDIERTRPPLRPGLTPEQRHSPALTSGRSQGGHANEDERAIGSSRYQSAAGPDPAQGAAPVRCVGTGDRLVSTRGAPDREALGAVHETSSGVGSSQDPVCILVTGER